MASSCSVTKMIPKSRSNFGQLFDGVFAACMGIFLALIVIGEHDMRPHDWILAVGLPLAVVQVVAVFLRRRNPLATMVVTLIAAFFFQLAAPSGVVPFALVVVLWSFAARRNPRQSIPALAVSLGICGMNAWTTNSGDTLFAMTCAVAAWALGEASRNRQKSFDQESRRLLADQRADIARELHDVIAHSVSVIVVQASAANDIFDAQPEQAKKALLAIEETGRDALIELRHLLERPVADSSDRPSAPLPKLEQLEGLIASMRETGMQVEFAVEGEPHAIPPGVELSAFRIVQEALTNALRHASKAKVWAKVKYGEDLVEIWVINESAPPSAWRGGSGLGIAGMKERATLLGGMVEAGVTPDGGFSVHAVLPISRSL